MVFKAFWCRFDQCSLFLIAFYVIPVTSPFANWIIVDMMSGQHLHLDGFLVIYQQLCFSDMISKNLIALRVHNVCIRRNNSISSSNDFLSV